MKLHFYAGLKDFFPPEMEVKDPFVSVQELKDFLILHNPSSKKLLDASRFAMESELLTFESVLQNDFVIAILPPSSGG